MNSKTSIDIYLVSFLSPGSHSLSLIRAEQSTARWDYWVLTVESLRGSLVWPFFHEVPKELIVFTVCHSCHTYGLCSCQSGISIAQI